MYKKHEVRKFFLACEQVLGLTLAILAGELLDCGGGRSVAGHDALGEADGRREALHQACPRVLRRQRRHRLGEPCVPFLHRDPDS
eukprot:1696665-Rhodomonas_salina.3